MHPVEAWQGFGKLGAAFFYQLDLLYFGVDYGFGWGSGLDLDSQSEGVDVGTCTLTRSRRSDDGRRAVHVQKAQTEAQSAHVSQMRALHEV